MFSRISLAISRRPFSFSTRFSRKAIHPRNSRRQAAPELVPETGIPGYSTGAKIAAGSAVFAFGALVYNGLNVGNTDRALDRVAFWPQHVRDRIRSSYGYLANSLLLTGGAAYLAMRSPTLMRMGSSGSMVGLFATIACLIGLQMATRSAPYVEGESNIPKHTFWALHSGAIGVIMAPLVAMCGDVVAQAALYTGGITAALSSIAWTAPSKEYLSWAGPVGMGIGAVFMASLASPFFPQNGMLFSFLMWGGLVLSSAFIFVQTQHMVATAENHPPHVAGYRDFDPVGASMGVYIAMINVFQRLLMILSMNKRK
jgi:FtsH-binding integral membrane protein